MGSINLSALVRHLSDSVKHITAAERTAWNAKAAGTHTHTKSQITDFPTSLPANGGNADTVGGKSVSDLASAEDSYWLYTYAANGSKHGAAHRIKATHNVKGDYRFHLQCESGEEVRVDFATDADTLDGYHAADLRSAPTAGSGTVGGSTAAAVTLGYKPSILLITSRQTSTGSDRNSALLLHSGSQSGSFTVSASTGGNSVTVTATLTATGFTVSAPGQNYGYPFDYIAYK